MKKIFDFLGWSQITDFIYHLLLKNSMDQPAPQYRTIVLIPYCGSRSLRSSSKLLSDPSSWLRTKVDKTLQGSSRKQQSFLETHLLVKSEVPRSFCQVHCEHAALSLVLYFRICRIDFLLIIFTLSFFLIKMTTTSLKNRKYPLSRGALHNSQSASSW